MNVQDPCGKREKTLMKPELGVRHQCCIRGCVLLQIYLFMHQHLLSTCWVSDLFCMGTAKMTIPIIQGQCWELWC